MKGKKLPRAIICFVFVSLIFILILSYDMNFKCIASDYDYCSFKRCLLITKATWADRRHSAVVIERKFIRKNVQFEVWMWSFPISAQIMGQTTRLMTLNFFNTFKQCPGFRDTFYLFSSWKNQRNKNL